MTAPAQVALKALRHLSLPYDYPLITLSLPTHYTRSSCTQSVYTYIYKYMYTSCTQSVYTYTYNKYMYTSFTQSATPPLITPSLPSHYLRTSFTQSATPPLSRGSCERMERAWA